MSDAITLSGPASAFRTRVGESSESQSQLSAQLLGQREQTRLSARKILALLFERYRPASILDVGCGLGAWLAAAGDLGVTDVAGVEEPWLQASRAMVDPTLITFADLAQPLDLRRRFDLVICLETAEHLAPEAAATLVASLVRHAPLVLFSAAIPFQRGPGHVNEQWPAYWAEHFAAHRYGMLDFIRNRLWYDQDVLWWYRQNVVCFAQHEWCATQPALYREAEITNLRPIPNALVLPDLFFTIARRLHDLENALLQGGHFQVEVDDHRLVHLKRLGAASDALPGIFPPHVTMTPPLRRRSSP